MIREKVFSLRGAPYFVVGKVRSTVLDVQPHRVMPRTPYCTVQYHFVKQLIQRSWSYGNCVLASEMRVLYCITRAVREYSETHNMVLHKASPPENVAAHLIRPETLPITRSFIILYSDDFFPLRSRCYSALLRALRDSGVKVEPSSQRLGPSPCRSLPASAAACSGPRCRDILCLSYPTPICAWELMS